ncbi:hypothetical protein [Noviherbaspirillum galbum]|uniref:Uncharacterized protein n=1 Tax=Noviherbaspirillum galbum TaxID=2709383 RepID=A0A6B3SRE1_9BURK|nr:hypothetical protein [Noviherbaspirillum galbum]NEX61346.1 hypothetical protein [Noviherbaspirillum galbum]
MANKALAKRQKLMIRSEPARRPVKGRAPGTGVAARPNGGVAGERAETVQQRLLKKLMGE